MRCLIGRHIKFLSTALILLGTTTAFGDDTLAVRVYNDTAEEIVVTVYDMNATPPEPILLRQRIYGFAWLSASLTPGRDGNGRVKWNAETTGTSFHRCGHRARRGLTNGATLRVFADSSCADSPP